MTAPKPRILVAPEPRSLDLIFRPDALRTLRETYDLVESAACDIDRLPDEALRDVHYIIGQPDIAPDLLARLESLRCIFNVEGNFMDNMPYETLFQRGIHTVTPGAVFALPVAELGLALALDLLRGVSAAHGAFQAGREVWGLESNRQARLLSGADVGLIGYGDLGQTVHRLLQPFGVTMRIHDPWLPPSVITEAGAEPVSLDHVISHSDVVFVVAGITQQNRGGLGKAAFAAMRPGAAFILLSRAEAVDFDALMHAVALGHIVAASDVFPEEPMPPDHPVRRLDGFLCSAHRAGAMEDAFFRMGDDVIEDLALMDRGLPPLRCRRAERETVALMRSRPVTQN